MNNSQRRQPCNVYLSASFVAVALLLAPHGLAQVVSPSLDSAPVDATPQEEARTVDVTTLDGDLARKQAAVASLVVTNVASQPAPGQYAGRYIGYRLDLQNTSDCAFIVNGDEAQATYADDKCLTPLSEDRTSIIAGRKMNAPKDAVLAAVTAGTLGVGEVLAEEVLQGGSKNPLVRHGRDWARWGVQDLRMGPRVLLPTEKTSGAIFLPKKRTPPSRISIPVLSYPDQTKLGQLIVVIDKSKL